MSRFKAAGLHLLISALVVGTIVLAMLLLWFPFGTIRIAGMDRLLATMLCVDIVAGPVLTGVAYKAGDPRTPRDLAVIGVLQACFLAYALHTAWLSRPVFLVWSVDSLYQIFANEIEDRNLADGRTPETRRLPWFGPRLCAIVLPRGHTARAAVFLDLIQKQTSLERLPMHYHPYEQARAAILRQSKPVSAFDSGERYRALLRAMEAAGRSAVELRVVAAQSSRNASLMLIDARTALPVATVPPPSHELAH